MFLALSASIILSSIVDTVTLDCFRECVRPPLAHDFRLAIFPGLLNGASTIIVGLLASGAGLMISMLKVRLDV
jgi:hypothetical protein